jgi:hypothetical protein
MKPPSERFPGGSRDLSIELLERWKGGPRLSPGKRLTRTILFLVSAALSARWVEIAPTRRAPRNDGANLIGICSNPFDWEYST